MQQTTTGASAYTLDDASGEFLRDCAVSLSPSTVQSYRESLRRFSEFLTERNVNACQDVSEWLDVDLILDFARWSRVQPGKRANGDRAPIGQSSLAGRLTATKQLFLHLVVNRKVSASASDLERLRQTLHRYRGKHPRHIPFVASGAVQAIIKAAHHAQAPERKLPLAKHRAELDRLRNIAIVEALYSTGMRVGELVRLKREDVSHTERLARVTGKGNKERLVFFHPRAWRALRVYWAERFDHGVKWRTFPAFAIHPGTAGGKLRTMSTAMVRQIVKELEASAGTVKHVTPHSFRHAFATKVLDKTGDLAAVQDLLGHESPETTRIYAEVCDRRKRAAHRLAFAPPERKIELEYLDVEMLQAIGLDVISTLMN